jgi:hypothetical protein
VPKMGHNQKGHLDKSFTLGNPRSPFGECGRRCSASDFRANEGIGCGLIFDDAIPTNGRSGRFPPTKAPSNLMEVLRHGVPGALIQHRPEQCKPKNSSQPAFQCASENQTIDPGRSDRVRRRRRRQQAMRERIWIIRCCVERARPRRDDNEDPDPLIARPHWAVDRAPGGKVSHSPRRPGQTVNIYPFGYVPISFLAMSNSRARPALAA